MARYMASVVAVLTSVVALTSCSHTASDDSLANSIKAALYSDQTTKQENIAVAVKDGVVTLSGNVSSPDAALEAMKVANGTAGTKRVTDQLTVNGAPDSAQLPNAGNGTAQTPTPVPAPPAQTVPTTPLPASSPAEPPRPPEPTTFIIPAGQSVGVRTIDAIDSKANRTGEVFRATLTSPLLSHGHVVIPVGADATLLLAEAKNSGKIEGRPMLEVRLTGIRFHGRRYQVDSSVFSETGNSRGKQTAVRTGIGAAAGAVIGALAGGGKGAAIGSAAGGGAGLGSDLFTHGPQVRIPSESVLTFKIEAPLEVQR